MLIRWAREFYLRVKFVYVDVDKDPAIAEDFDAKMVPTFIVFKEGRLYEYVEGTETKKIRRAIGEVVNFTM